MLSYSFFLRRALSIPGSLHVQIIDKVTFFASPAKEQASTVLTPRFGTAITDGDHKAEAYFLFNDAKHYLPGEEFNLLRFKTDVVGEYLPSKKVSA
jgi:hypothetical protein